MTGRALRMLGMGLVAAVLEASTATRAQAQPLLADLSSHLVSITIGFTGGDVLLFGSTEGVGDVIVVVRGPEGEATVRRKSRVAGVWVNSERLTFRGVPTYYAIAASGPLDTLVRPEVAERHGIGVEYLRLEPTQRVDRRDGVAFRDALLRGKARSGLYPTEIGDVTFLGRRLFRAEISFPDNVPTGNYLVQVLLVQDGDVVSAQTTPLRVEKAGLEALIFDFAHEFPARYGLAAIFIAVVAGWAAGAVFRKA